MTKKDYELIAKVLKSTEPSGDDPAATVQWEETVKAFASVLTSTNGKFDRVRFYQACFNRN